MGTDQLNILDQNDFVKLNKLYSNIKYKTIFYGTIINFFPWIFYKTLKKSSFFNNPFSTNKPLISYGKWNFVIRTIFIFTITLPIYSLTFVKFTKDYLKEKENQYLKYKDLIDYYVNKKLEEDIERYKRNMQKKLEALEKEANN